MTIGHNGVFDNLLVDKEKRRNLLNANRCTIFNTYVRLNNTFLSADFAKMYVL